MKSLDSPLHNEEICVHLFARNVDIGLFNYNKLQNLPGELKVCSSADEGSHHYFNKCLAQQNKIKTWLPCYVNKQIEMRH